jgi:hypothetical protein
MFTPNPDAAYDDVIAALEEALYKTREAKEQAGG